MTAASSAVAVDDSRAEPYASLAYARFLYGWDWKGAEDGFQAAIDQYERTLENNADFVLAPRFLGPAFVMSGQYDLAIEVCERWIPRVRHRSGLLALLAYAYAMAAGETRR